MTNSIIRITKIYLAFRNLLTEKPPNNHALQIYIGAFFKKPRESIVKELHQYLVKIKCKDEIVKNLQKEAKKAELNKSYSFVLCQTQLERGT